MRLEKWIAERFTEKPSWYQLAQELRSSERLVDVLLSRLEDWQNEMIDMRIRLESEDSETFKEKLEEEKVRNSVLRKENKKLREYFAIKEKHD